MADTKLKQLKVAELKEILIKAQIPLGKANKADLIQKILDSPVALQVYAQLHPDPAAAAAQDPIQAIDNAPAEVTHPASVAAPAASTKPPSVPVPAAAPAEPVVPTTTNTTTGAAPATSTTTAESADTSAPSVEDEELERRRKRAARFNIPLVEPKPKKAPQPKGPKAAPVNEDPDALARRAARFGLATKPAATADDAAAKPAATRGSKRSAPIEETVDAEELERRKKRAERFGTSVNGATKA